MLRARRANLPYRAAPATVKTHASRLVARAWLCVLMIRANDPCLTALPILIRRLSRGPQHARVLATRRKEFSRDEG